MFVEFIKGYGILLCYFAVCASSALVLRRFVPMPDELFRKIFAHDTFLGSIFGWMYAFKTWWVSAIAAIVFILMVFPILAFAETCTRLFPIAYRA